MSALGEKIRAAREGKEWSQSDLAKHAGVSQQTIAKIEQGVTGRSRHLADLAKALQIDMPEYGIFGASTPALPPISPEFDDLKRRGTPIYATSPSKDGPTLKQTDPLEVVSAIDVLGASLGYGLYLIEPEMQPAFEPGDRIIVREGLPAMPETYCAFLSAPNQDGVSLVRVRKLLSIEDDGWTVQQFAPPLIEKFPLEKWPHARRIVARYLRS